MNKLCKRLDALHHIGVVYVSPGNLDQTSSITRSLGGLDRPGLHSLKVMGH